MLTKCGPMPTKFGPTSTEASPIFSQVWATGGGGTTTILEHSLSHTCIADLPDRPGDTVAIPQLQEGSSVLIWAQVLTKIVLFHELMVPHLFGVLRFRMEPRVERGRLALVLQLPRARARQLNADSSRSHLFLTVPRPGMRVEGVACRR